MASAMAATGCWKIEMAKNVPISTASEYALRNMGVNDEHDPCRVSPNIPEPLVPGPRCKWHSGAA
jgi:hypothetical protein